MHCVRLGSSFSVVFLCVPLSSDVFILDDNFSINSNETAIMLFEDATYRGEPVIGAQGSQDIEEILNKLKGRNS